jgi:hypothetical protein
MSLTGRFMASNKGLGRMKEVVAWAVALIMTANEMSEDTNFFIFHSLGAGALIREV